MFHRVTPEEWSQITAVAGFALTFLVFLIALFKACRTTRDTASYMATRPLELDWHPKTNNLPPHHE